MNELIKVNYEDANRPTVMGRELHEDFKTCFPKMESYRTQLD